MTNITQHNNPHNPLPFPKKEKNEMGLAGFIVSIVGLLFGWVPFFGWILWIVGLVLSIIGVTKQPKGYAIAGIVISLVSVLVLLVIIGMGAFFLNEAHESMDVSNFNP